MIVGGLRWTISTFFDGAPAIQPTNLTAEPGYEQVTLRWTDPGGDDPSIRGWAYSMKAGAGNWSDWETIPDGRSILNHTVQNLDHGILYSFKVCAVNAAGEGPPSETSVALINVAYGAESYDVLEGGAPVEITVRLTPSPLEAVSIPVQVSADAGTEEEDYAVPGLMDGTLQLSFPQDSSSQSFTLTANEDDDSANQTVTLSFGMRLPSGIMVGMPSEATVTLLDAAMPSFSPASDSQTRRCRHLLFLHVTGRPRRGPAD